MFTLLFRTHGLLDPPHIAIKLALARLLLSLTSLGELAARGEEKEDGADRLRGKCKELGVKREEVLEAQGSVREAERTRPLMG